MFCNSTGRSIRTTIVEDDELLYCGCSGVAHQDRGTDSHTRYFTFDVKGRSRFSEDPRLICANNINSHFLLSPDCSVIIQHHNHKHKSKSKKPAFPHRSKPLATQLSSKEGTDNKALSNRKVKGTHHREIKKAAE
jgi:hypothetical protein